MVCTQHLARSSTQQYQDVITDLQRAGVIGDPLTDTNWKNTTWFNGDWAYSKTFSWPPPQQSLPAHATASGADVLLVFEGIKMGARISLNGHVLGNSTDQFLRLKFPVGPLLKPTDNMLQVEFLRQIPTHGRFMACSGGWDWAPYSDLRSVEGHQMLTKGIWRSVYLVTVPTGSVAILHAVPTTHFVSAGRADGADDTDWPVHPLPDDGSSHFTVNRLCTRSAPLSGTTTVTRVGSALRFLPITRWRRHLWYQRWASAVKLWWPRGSVPNGCTTSQPALPRRRVQAQLPKPP